MSAEGSGHPDTKASALEALHVGKKFDTNDGVVEAVRDVNLAIGEQEFVTILGPSGCGKTTVLHMFGGLTNPTSGEVRYRGSKVDSVPYGIGMVFQRANLLPWRNIRRNVSLPLETLKIKDSVAWDRIDEVLEMVGLADFGGKLPRQLSGGMQQRAALARALIHDPSVLLMDEPFGALDAITRERMNIELLRIWDESRTTVVLVTHSIPEAIFLADRVVVMSPRPGQIQHEVKIPFARPRTIDLMSAPEFGEIALDLRRRIDEFEA